jgi:hypothetical protein
MGLGIRGPAGEQETGAAIRAAVKQFLPYRSASREMSLMLAILYSNRSRTGFEKAE